MGEMEGLERLYASGFGWAISGEEGGLDAPREGAEGRSVFGLGVWSFGVFGSDVTAEGSEAGKRVSCVRTGR